MRFHLHEDRWASILIAIAVIAYWADVRSLQTLRSDDVVGPVGFPSLITAITLILSGCLFARPQKDVTFAALSKLALGYWLILLLYTLAIPFLGFGLSTAIFLGVLLYALDVKPVPLTIAVMLITGGIFLVFNYFLGLKLTLGPWG